MDVKCSNCGKINMLDNDQVNLIGGLKKKGSVFGMLGCKWCGLGFAVNPQTIEVTKDFGEELVWRSPISGSHGFVSFVDNDDEKSFYGCGETGVTWGTKASFYRDIKSVIERYPHRSFFYEEIDGDWFPSKNEPKNVDELINSEGQEEIFDFER